MSLKITTLTCNSHNYTNETRSASNIKYIVIHFTSNNGDTARGNANYFRNNILKNKASAHYFVDENEAYLSVPENYIACHCGTSGTYYHPSCRNKNSIGIELCSRMDSNKKYYFKKETIENAIELTKMMMKKYNIPVSNVVRHYDVTHKNCPAPFVSDISAWNNFKSRLTGSSSVVTEKITTSSIKKLTTVNDVCYRLGPNGSSIIKEVDYWMNRFNKEPNIFKLATNAANYTLSHKKGSHIDELSVINDIAYKLKVSGIITATDYWMNEMGKDKNIYFLCKSIANWIY